MNYYIKDATDNNTILYANTVAEVVSHLEKMLFKKHRVTRKQYMQNLIELGHGYDDAEGRVFAEQLRNEFEFGVIKQNRHVKCNIHDVEKYSKYRAEMGD